MTDKQQIAYLNNTRIVVLSRCENVHKSETIIYRSSSIISMLLSKTNIKLLKAKFNYAG